MKNYIVKLLLQVFKKHLVVVDEEGNSAGVSFSETAGNKVIIHTTF